MKYRFVPIPMHLTFWFALFWNWPHRSSSVAAWRTAKPSCMSPVGSHFQGGILPLLGSAARMVWKVKLYQLWAQRDGRKSPVSILPASSSSAARFSLKWDKTYYQSDRNQGTWKRKKTGIVKLQETLYGGRGGRKQQINNVRGGESLRKWTDLLESGKESNSVLDRYLWTSVVSSSGSTILWALREDYIPFLLICLLHQMGKSAYKQQKCIETQVLSLPY